MTWYRDTDTMEDKQYSYMTYQTMPRLMILGDISAIGNLTTVVKKSAHTPYKTKYNDWKSCTSHCFYRRI